jgi:hypothetical protein
VASSTGDADGSEPYALRSRPDLLTPYAHALHPPTLELAYFLAARAQATSLAYVGVRPPSPEYFGGRETLRHVFFQPTGSPAAELHPDVELIPFDVEDGLPSSHRMDVAASIVLCRDVLERIPSPGPLLDSLARWSQKAPFIIVETPDRERRDGLLHPGPPTDAGNVREWSHDEFRRTIASSGFPDALFGHTDRSWPVGQKRESVAITGTHAVPQPEARPRVLAVMAAYNEQDIIEPVLKHLRAQGIDVVVLDNWSTDATPEIVGRLARSDPGIELRRFPREGPRRFFELAPLLDEVARIGMTSDHDWIMHYDADEIRTGPWPQYTMAEAFGVVDRLGYNAVDFTVVDFRPVRDGFVSGVEPTTFFRNFEFGRDRWHFVQVKAWKNEGQKVVLSASGGHEAEFPGRRVFPLKFLLNHYSLRSPRQAREKIFKQRKPRFSPAERARGWHVHYDAMAPEMEFLWKPESLDSLDAADFHDEYLLERVAGIGIPPRS